MNWLVVAAGIARVVIGPGSDPPDMQPDDAVLFVHRANTCVPDAGIPDASLDAGMPVDAPMAIPDASGPTAPPPDAYVPDAGPSGDGGVPDAGIPDAGTTMCGDSVMMVVQPRFTIASRGSTFALLYVTPAPPVMRLESPNTFDDLATLTAPDIDTQIVEIPDPALGTRCPGCGGGGDYNGGGCSFESNPSWDPPSGGGSGIGGSTIQTVGPYEVATRQPTSRAEVAKWLDDLGYLYTDQDLTALEPYFSHGWSVVAVRVSQQAAFSGGLEPLSMTWAGSDVTIPLRLASQSSLTVYIAGDHRYEVPNAHVSFAANTGSTFLTRNDVSDLSSDLTAYRASVDSYTHDVMVVYQDMHVPVTRCEDQGCCQSGPGTTNGIMWGLALFTVVGRRKRSARHRRAARTPAAPCDSSARSCSRDG
jgi:hypothetical protein